MFYLKYRPRKLEELDNSKARTEITNILKSNKIPHALLFSGPKGTGKTSTARIFAKSVNCLSNKFAGKGDSIEPCGKCKSCVAIDQSSSVDVIELDAASNRGVEEIKSLIYSSSFLPMVSRYRVFIIDEAHMITQVAFNALLKTLEEPPPSVIFILATTNPEKLPKTIISRCTQIKFGQAKEQDIIRMLERIIKNEKINIDKEVLNLIAQSSDYSFRDAAKILEELVTQKALTSEKAAKILATRQKNLLLKFLSEKDPKKTLDWIEKFVEEGGNVKNLITSSIQTLKELLLIQKGVKEGGKEYSQLKFTNSEITLLLKLLLEAYRNMSFSPIESLPLEIAVVEFTKDKQ